MRKENRKRKRFISYLLMVTMLLSLFQITPASAGGNEIETDTDSVTIHYYNENNWNEPYLYYYYDSQTGTPWPGVAMTAEGNGWYTYEIQRFSTARVIFSNKGSNQNPVQNQEGFLISGEKWYKNGRFYDTNPDSLRITVHYHNTNGWNNPHIYYYGENETPVTWPGKAMIPEGNGWYFYDIYGLTEANVIFSDNGINQIPAQNQTGYTVTGDKWYADGIWYDTKPQPGITIHYHNYHNWNQVNLYYYNGNREGADWTGVPMEPDGDGWYSYEIYGYDTANILFNNGNGIQIPGAMEEGFPVSGERWYRNGSWSTERPEEIIVYFYKPDQWTNANLYYYKTDSDTGPTWPGTAMKQEQENWYSYTITKYDAGKVMFNDGNGNRQIPGYMQPGLEATGVMWYRDGVWCNTETDTDGDGLLDYMELISGTDVNNVDTDGDGLSDAQELYITKTNPLQYDSVITGISDADVDLDADGLSNRWELELGTNPLEADTDEDGLTDGDEVMIYFSNPLVADTDGDTLSDGDDVALGFSPILADTNGNGILDCDEKIEQTMTQPITEDEKPEVTEVTVRFNGTRNIQTTTTIKNIYNIDLYTSDVVGLVGVPVDIETTSDFDEAEICFYVDETKLEDCELSDLIVLWNDEENNRFLVQESILDSEQKTITATVQHFSKYMLVDKEKWFQAWRDSIDYTIGMKTSYDTVIAIDCSGSMSDSDQLFTYTYRDTLYPGSSYDVRTCYRRLASEDYIKAQNTGDRTAVVLFESSSMIACNLTDSRMEAIQAVDRVYSSGGTDFESAIGTSISVLSHANEGSRKTILLLSDGQSQISNATLANAKAQGITIHTVFIGSGTDNPLMQHIAEQTGGEYFQAVTAEELMHIYSQIAINQTIDDTDTDGDGIPDVFEIYGMRLSNGRIMYSNPELADTDGDGLLDGEEIIPIPIPYFKSILDVDGSVMETKGYMFVMKSDPNKRDTDGDGLHDGAARKVNKENVVPKDPEPLIVNGPKGIWNEQYKQEIRGTRITHELGKWYEMRDEKSWFPAILGSLVLYFRSDEKNIAIHSQVDTWQSMGGYNNMYDSVFNWGTRGNMKKEKFEFKYDGETYVIWAWKGDYMNLGSGAEVGIYQNPHTIYLYNLFSPYGFTSFEQWDVADFRLYMTLNLYNYYGENRIENIFCWAPYDAQWWITGFNPNFDNPVAEDMVSVGTINFKGREGMFEALKTKVEGDEDLKDFMIFDEDGHTVWFIWWEV